MIKMLKNNWVLFAVLAVFLSVKIFLLLTYDSVFLDEYEYLGMGRFIFSGGDEGSFSEMRPLFVPLIVGLSSWVDVDMVLFGWIVSLFFSVGVIVVSYVLAKKFFTKSAAVWTVMLLSAYPLFFGYSHRILTHMPAVFFAMLAVYLFSEKFYGWCGFVAALAFMARFPHGILFVPLALFVLFSSGSWKNIFKFLFGYIVPVMCFLIFNIFFYRNVTANFFDAMVRPFVIANESIMSHNLNLYAQPFYYYFVRLFLESWLFVLLLAFVFFYFKNKLYDSHSCDLFVTVALFYSVYFSWLAHKEFRYALDFLPFLVVFVAYSLDEILFFIKKRRKWIYYLLSFVVLVLVVFSSVRIGYGYLGVRDHAQSELCDFFMSYGENYSLFSTSSAVVPCTEMSFYGMYFDIEGSVGMFLNSSDYSLFLFSNSTFPCADRACEDVKSSALKRLSDNSDLIFETRSKYEYFAVFKKN